MESGGGRERRVFINCFVAVAGVDCAIFAGETSEVVALFGNQAE